MTEQNDLNSLVGQERVMDFCMRANLNQEQTVELLDMVMDMMSAANELGRHDCCGLSWQPKTH